MNPIQQIYSPFHAFTVDWGFVSLNPYTIANDGGDWDQERKKKITKRYRRWKIDYSSHKSQGLVGDDLRKLWWEFFVGE